MITHPEKILFPDDGITKGDVAEYYEALAPVIVPHLVGRPITMERYPSGIGEQGFSGFDPRVVAQFTEAGVERLMQDPGIIRARSKIVATIGNARAYLATDAAGEDFSSSPFHVSQRPANASGSPSRR